MKRNCCRELLGALRGRSPPLQYSFHLCYCAWISMRAFGNLNPTLQIICGPWALQVWFGIVHGSKCFLGAHPPTQKVRTLGPPIAFFGRDVLCGSSRRDWILGPVPVMNGGEHISWGRPIPYQIYVES